VATFFNQAVKNLDTSEILAVTSDSDNTIILSILCANTDGTGASDLTVRREDASSTDKGYLAFTIPVPADSNFDVLSNRFVLPSGDKILVSSNVSGTLDIQVSYLTL